MSSVTLKIVNPALIEGGPDAARNSFGGFYTIATADDGQQSLEYSASNLVANQSGKEQQLISSKRKSRKCT